MLNLSAVLEQHARRRPDAEALVCGDKRLTYAQLDAWANQIANALAASGIRRGDHVALLCPNLPYFPAVYFGILKTGATVVPLNVLLKPREIAYHLRDSDAKAMFCFQGTPELPMAEAAKAAIAVVPACKTLIVLPHPSASARSRFRRRGRGHPARAVHRRPAARVRDGADQARRHGRHSLYVWHDRAAEGRGADAPEHGRQRDGVCRAVRVVARRERPSRDRHHPAAVSCHRADRADARVLPSGRHARAAAALRSGGAADGDDDGARHALDRRADDVLDAAEVRERAGHRRVEDGRDAAACGIGRRAHAGRADEGFREDVRRPHHRRLRPVGDGAGRELQPSRSAVEAGHGRVSRCLPSIS